MHCQGNGQIECVVCRFVVDNRFVSVHGEAGDVAVSRLQVHRLANGCDQHRFMEQLDELDVAGQVAEMLAQQVVNAVLNHRRIVDGAHFDVVDAIPAR